MLKQKRVFVLTDANVEAAHRARVEAALSASGITSSWLALKRRVRRRKASPISKPFSTGFWKAARTGPTFWSLLAAV